jgi:hypothetical protein
MKRNNWWNKPIEDLHYVVVQKRALFSRRGHALILYRHDARGLPFVWHVESFYATDGRVSHNDARRRGADIVNRRGFYPGGYRDVYLDTNISLAAIHAKIPGMQREAGESWFEKELTAMA